MRLLDLGHLFEQIWFCWFGNDRLPLLSKPSFISSAIQRLFVTPLITSYTWCLHFISKQKGLLFSIFPPFSIRHMLMVLHWMWMSINGCMSRVVQDATVRFSEYCEHMLPVTIYEPQSTGSARCFFHMARADQPTAPQF